MLQVNDVSYAIGDRQILDSVSFSMMPGEKAALVGANGAGKTTLVKIIVGELVEDEGTVCKPKSISYVPQIITDDVLVQMHGTVKEFMLEGRNLNQLFATMNETTTALGSPNISEEETKRVMRRYSNAQEEFCLRCGYEAEAEIETILHGVGIAIDINRFPTACRQQTLATYWGVSFSLSPRFFSWFLLSVREKKAACLCAS
jgi:ATP-binding cassette subfamily F protein 3